MCFTPNYAIRDKRNKLVFIIDPIEYYKLQSGMLSSDFELLKLPCGTCMDCRMNYAREWAMRCVAESQIWKYNYFLTLTYNDENLPVVNEKTGEILDHSTLRPSHIVQFCKSLRQNFSRRGHVGIRFFMAGEYGDKSFRPHYHMIVFNLPLNDLIFYKKSKLGFLYYTSPSLERIWNKGFVVVGDLTAASAAYTARYCLKKCKDLYSDKYDSLGIIPEYTNCSRRPGIGWAWYEMNKDKLFLEGFVPVSDGEKSVNIRPIRYFKKMYKDYNSYTYEYRCELNKLFAINQREVQLFQTDYSDIELDMIHQSNFEFKNKIFMNRSEI